MESNEVSTESSVKNNKKNWIIGAVVVSVVLLILTIAQFGNFDSQIMKVSEQGIRDGLKYNAEEAEFSGADETEVFFSGTNDDYCEVTGWVIAANGYGARTKVAYEADLEKDSEGKWEFDDFTLEDDEDEDEYEEDEEGDEWDYN